MVFCKVYFSLIECLISYTLSVAVLSRNDIFYFQFQFVINLNKKSISVYIFDMLLCINTQDIPHAIWIELWHRLRHWNQEKQPRLTNSKCKTSYFEKWRHVIRGEIRYLLSVTTHNIWKQMYHETNSTYDEFFFCLEVDSMVNTITWQHFLKNIRNQIS